jgi:CMP-N-acetylneuraminic acid synthetase
MSIKILAIIPARSGSKRLPGKNIKELQGAPLIAWTINSALASKYITKTIVSTDSIDISTIAQKSGAQVPFIRPDALSSDSSSSIDVVRHAIEYIEKKNEFYDYTILLQPTSPLRTTSDIDSAIELLLAKKSDAVISVTPEDHSPLWTNTLDSNLSMDNFLSDHIKNSRSQDLKQYYRLNGAIYIANTKKLLLENTFFLKNNTSAFIMSKENSVDIDEEIDFLLASSILEQKANYSRN